MSKNKNNEYTRYFSDLHEKTVCHALNGRQVSNSGAGKFEKGDVVVGDASLLIECKTAMTEKASFSVKQEWLTKNREEAFRNRLSNGCLCFNFEPNGSNYYVINEKLMQVLVNALTDIQKS